MWKNKQEFPLTAESLKMLFDNQLPLLRLEQFATSQECEMLVAEAQSLEFDSYRNVTPKIERIGITVFEYNRISKADYFLAVERVSKLRDHIFAYSFNPLERFITQIQSCTNAPVRIASEPFYGDYYAGLTRKIESGTQLHIDYAPSEQAEWEVGTVVAQLAWNLYLNLSPENQGKTCIYDRLWQPEDDLYKLDSYGYNEAVIAGADSTIFQPIVGDVFIFNTRNYHTVEPIDGQRVTFTSAIGLLPNGEIILWS